MQPLLQTIEENHTEFNERVAKLKPYMPQLQEDADEKTEEARDAADEVDEKKFFVKSSRHEKPVMKTKGKSKDTSTGKGSKGKKAKGKDKPDKTPTAKKQAKGTGQASRKRPSAAPPRGLDDDGTDSDDQPICSQSST
jgi:hypothetical protein